MITREQYIAEALTFDRVQYRHQGRSRDGIDCIGMITTPAELCGAAHVGEVDRENPGYSRQPDGVSLIREFNRCLLHVPDWQGTILHGDVAVLRIGRRPRHAAWFLWRGRDLYMLHSLAGRRVALHVASEKWLGRIVRLYEPPLLPPHERRVHEPQPEYEGPDLRPLPVQLPSPDPR